MPGDHMIDPMKPMMPMEMCPATKPEDGSACKGHRMCPFDALVCRCMKEAWSCGPNEMMMPDGDGGPMPP
jgi:hypothetical protein